jgi:hypothetical protein
VTFMLAFSSSTDNSSAPSVRALEINTDGMSVQHVQRLCVGRFRLAERPCDCTRKLRAWYMLGIADYLMEEVIQIAETKGITHGS